jgi:hypothetical protein
MAKRSFEDKVAELDALSSLRREEALPALQTALRNSTNCSDTPQ